MFGSINIMNNKRQIVQIDMSLLCKEMELSVITDLPRKQTKS